MRRAYAYRIEFNFNMALQDLKKLRELIHPQDKALAEVRKLHNHCVRGIQEGTTPFEFTSTDRYDNFTSQWIDDYRNCEGVAKIEYVKNYTVKQIKKVFKHYPIP